MRLSTQQIENAKRVPVSTLLSFPPTALKWEGEWLSTPCPKCEGVDRFCVSRSNVWFCRQCGKRSFGAIEFIKWRDGLYFREAVQALLNGDAVTEQNIKLPISPRPTDFTATYHMMRKGFTVDCEPFQYAVGRGLSKRVLRLYGVANGGYGKSLAFPYWHDGKVTAIKFRNLQGDRKYNLMPRSQMLQPFGMNTIEGHSHLLICEGELNAMSVRQVADVDCVSFGSESIGKAMIPHLENLASNYTDVLIWTDKKSTAEQLLGIIPHARGGASLEDANDKLQRGILAQLLAKSGIPMVT